MNADTATQLQLLREIAAALDAAGIEWWLFGGWAMDLNAGRVTRNHADIEIFSWKRDAAVVREAMWSAAFPHAVGLYPAETQTFLKLGQEIGVWFIERDEVGRICTPGRWADWPWLARAFDGPRLVLDGVKARALSIEGLLDMKTHFAAHPHGAPLRQKDVGDIALLRSLLVARPP